MQLVSLLHVDIAKRCCCDVLPLQAELEPARSFQSSHSLNSDSASGRSVGPEATGSQTSVVDQSVPQSTVSDVASLTSAATKDDDVETEYLTHHQSLDEIAVVDSEDTASLTESPTMTDTLVDTTRQTYSVEDVTAERQQEPDDNEAWTWMNEELSETSSHTADKLIPYQHKTIPDQRGSVPLSGSAIRGTDIVTVDILDQIIKDDIRELSVNCSWSLCQLAGIIVLRVLDSARNKVIRDNQLPTGTDQVRREAILLVEDVISTSMIYAGGGYRDPARTRRVWTPTSTKPKRWTVSNLTYDAAWQKQSTSAHVEQLQDEERDEGEDEDTENDELEDGSSATIEQQPSLAEQQQSVVGLLPPLNQQQYVDTTMQSLDARLSIITPSSKQSRRTSQQQPGSDSVTPAGLQSILYKPAAIREEFLSRIADCKINNPTCNAKVRSRKDRPASQRTSAGSGRDSSRDCSDNA